MRLDSKVQKSNISLIERQNDKKNRLPLWGSILVFLLVGGSILATILGAKSISPSEILSAIFSFDETNNMHQVFMTVRLPRVLAAIITGAGFAVSGAIIQGITRNPIADSGILGLNAGAGLMLVIAMIFLPKASFTETLWLCILGTALGASCVFGVGFLSINGLKPIRLVLAGAAISAMLTALSEAMSIFFSISQQVAFWYGGGLSGIQFKHLQQVIPWMFTALIGSILLSNSISLLSLGENTAKGLGLKITKVRILSFIVAIILAGISCALAGAISFVGLLAPHLVRYLVGYDYRLVIPLSAVMGAIIVVIADMVARIVNAPYEIPVGAILSVIGIPFFLMLARKEGRKNAWD